MWFIGVEVHVEQEKSAPPPKINPGSAPAAPLHISRQLIHYDPHFLLTIITHVGGSNGVNMGGWDLCSIR